MGLSVLYCGTPYRELIQCRLSEIVHRRIHSNEYRFLFHEALGIKLSHCYIATNPSFLNIVTNPSF